MKLILVYSIFKCEKNIFSCTRVSLAVPLVWTGFSIQCKDKCFPTPPIYLWSKVVLFLFCHITSHHAEISQTTVLHVRLLVYVESSQWERCIDLVCDCFGAMIWKLLMIEPFSQWKVNKIENEKCIEGIRGVVGKRLASQI